MRLPMEASAVNNSYGQGFRKTRAHQAPDRRVPERCRSRVALPRAHTLPLLIEARGEPTSACKRFFGAILRANAKDRDFRRRSAANVRCRFPPTGGLFFRPLSHMQLCPPQPNSPPDTVIRAARPTREGSSLRREARRDAGPRGPATAARRFTD